MKRDFESVLDDCLHRLGTGGDLDACLSRYPEHASELQPLLLLATDLATLDAPPPVESARQAARQRMLTSVRQRKTESATVVSRLVERFLPRITGNIRLARRFATMVPLILLIMLTSAVTVGASRSSLPGDTLYPVKLTAQRARMVFTLDKSNRDALIQQIDKERRQDIQSALQGDREAKVEFEGTLQEISKGEWIVGGLQVNLNTETVVQGKPVIGVTVSVRGRLPGDGTLLAVSLQVSESDDLFNSPLPTPSPSATPEPIETEEDVDEDDHTPEPVETDELEDDDNDETPEATEIDDSDDGDETTPEGAETDEPDDDDDVTAEPDEDDDGDNGTAEPNDDDDAATSVPGGDPDDEDESTPTPTATDDDSEDDVTPTPAPDGTEEPDDDETPEPDGTDEPDDDDDDPESPEEPTD